MLRQTHFKNTVRNFKCGCQFWERKGQKGCLSTKWNQKKAEMRPMRPMRPQRASRTPVSKTSIFPPPALGPSRGLAMAIFSKDFHAWWLWWLPVSHCQNGHASPKKHPKRRLISGINGYQLSNYESVLIKCYEKLPIGIIYINIYIYIHIILQLLTSHHSLLWRKSAMKSSGGQLLRFEKPTSMRWKVLVIPPQCWGMKKKYLWALSFKKMEN